MSLKYRGGKEVWRLLQALFSERNGMKDDSTQQKELFLLLNKETDEQKNSTCAESREIKKRLLTVTACLCQAT